MSNIEYQIGEIEPSELNFILSSYKKSYREACADQRTSEYFVLATALAEEMLSRFPLILVARNPEGVILSWLMCSGSDEAFTLWYAYTKSYARRKGLFKALLAQALDQLPDAGDKLIIAHRTRHYPTAVRYGFTHVPAARLLQESV